MRFSLPAVVAGGLAAVAILTVADIATSQANRAVSGDAAILSALEFTHSAEITTGELAESKATSQEVKDLGKNFAAAHKQARDEVRDLGKKLNVEVKVADDDPMKTAFNKKVEGLKALDGKAFDKAFVDHEVTFHQAAIDKIKAMEPEAVSPDVKSLLTRTLGAVQSHLQLAKALQSKIVATE
jgi:putative membrane protein